MTTLKDPKLTALFGIIYKKKRNGSQPISVLKEFPKQKEVYSVLLGGGQEAIQHKAF